MWRSWGKSSTPRLNDTSSTTSPFTFSSFKDIETLCAVEPPQPARRISSVFNRVRLTNSLLRTWSTRLPSQIPLQLDLASSSPNPVEESLAPAKQSEPSISLPGSEKRIVVYFTSLRVVRSTFEACKAVRSILRGFRVSIDERDLSMDSRFLSELQQILGQRKLTVPRVFIGGRYIGGADEIKQLNETGELKKIVEGLPVVDTGVCESCGGYRFILCEECNGSHKLYSEKGGGFKCCTTCNENGLIRCPSCSYAPLCDCWPRSIKKNKKRLCGKQNVIFKRK